MTQFEADRLKRQQEWQERFIKHAREFYKQLEDAGIKTSVANVEREPEDLPIIWTIPASRGRIIDE